MTEPSTGVDPAESKYRARHARRRQLIAAGLLFFFAGVPVIAYLVIEAFS